MEKVIGGEIKSFRRTRIISYVSSVVLIVISIYMVCFLYKMDVNLRIKDLNLVNNQFYNYLQLNNSGSHCLEHVSIYLDIERSNYHNTGNFSGCEDPYGNKGFLERMLPYNKDQSFSLIIEASDLDKNEIYRFLFFEKNEPRILGFKIKSSLLVADSLYDDRFLVSVYAEGKSSGTLYLIFLIVFINIFLVLLLTFFNLESLKQLHGLSEAIIEKINSINYKDRSSEKKNINKDMEISNIKKSFDFLFYILSKKDKEMEDIIERISNYNRVLGHEILSPLQSLKIILHHHNDGLRKINRIIRSIKSIENISGQERFFAVNIIEKINIDSFLESYVGNQESFIKNLNFLNKGIENKFIDTDAEALEQILDHIINNANYYRDDETHIIVRINDDGIFLNIEIENIGPKIKDDFLSKIFELGFSSKKSKDNLGQGLYVAKILSKKIGGDIFVKNIEIGVVFTIRLPLIQD